MRVPDTTETEAFWRDGFVVVKEALSGEPLARAVRAVHASTPTRAQVEDDPGTFAFVHSFGLFQRNFPFGDELDRLVVDEDIVRWSAAQIGTPDLALGDGMLWRKFAGYSDFDQALHQDYGNNDLVYPRRDGGFLQLTFILYLSDVSAEHGPTYAAPHPAIPAGTPTFVTDKDLHAEVYAAEQPVLAQSGDLLVYETSTFHRGSSMLRPDAERLSLHFQYAAAAHRWMGKIAFGVRGGHPEMTAFLLGATPRQRSLVGFPSPDSDYWTAETLRAVAVRYPDMDLTPYEAAAAAPKAKSIAAGA